jgi:replication initiation and membrane attachment protein
MKISNMLQFTEKHRYCVFRDFAISPLQHKMLTSVYQPMIGGLAVSFYLTLYGMLPPDRAGYSSLEQQRKLFLSLDLEQGDRGRASLLELASKLEAVGLLQTVRRKDPFEEDYMYEYLLYMPLSPNEFFQTDHLIWLLHDRVGKHMLVTIREEVWSPEPNWHLDGEHEDITSAFFDLFRISPYTADNEMERMMQEAAAAKAATVRDTYEEDTSKYTLDQILVGFPHFSENRKYIERLDDKPDQLYLLNFVVAKYDLDLTDLRWVLDSSNLFDHEGILHKQRLEEEAKLIYLQREKRSDRRAVLSGRKEELIAQDTDAIASSEQAASMHQVEEQYLLEIPPLLQSQYSDVHKYNLHLRNLPYTKVLEFHFPNGVTPDVREAFLELNSLYKLPDEVINVLMHFISIEGRLWERFPIKNLATDINGKQQGNSFESAVEYVRNRIKSRQQAAASAREASARAAKSRGRAGGSARVSGVTKSTQKPHIPIAKQGEGVQAKPSDKELEEMLQLARKLDEKFK